MVLAPSTAVRRSRPLLRRCLLLAVLVTLPVALATPDLRAHEHQAAGLDCWVPTREQHYADGVRNPNSPLIAPMRKALLEADQVVRDNPHFRAMPRRIRIRTTIAVGGGEPRYGQLNTNAYQPEVWAEGKCDVVEGADRCCRDGNISIFFNNPTTFLVQALKDPAIEMFDEPVITGTVGGFPEYNNTHVMLSLGNKVPWTPVTVEEFLGFAQRRAEKLKADQDALEAKPAPFNEKKLMETYELMKTLDPKGADKFLADMKKMLAEYPAQAARQKAEGDAMVARGFAEVAALRATFTPQQLKGQAHLGAGPLGLGKPGDRGSRPLVKVDPNFGWDKKDLNRVQFVAVFVGVVENDQIAGRRETMRQAKQSFDYPRLAKLLR